MTEWRVIKQQHHFIRQNRDCNSDIWEGERKIASHLSAEDAAMIVSHHNAVPSGDVGEVALDIAAFIHDDKPDTFGRIARAISHALDTAVRKEREACAKVADDKAPKPRGAGTYLIGAVATEIAAAIRART